MAKVDAITISQNMIRRENENKREEIYQLAKNLGYSVEVVTDNPEITEDENFHRKEKEEKEEQTAMENRRRRNQEILEKKDKERMETHETRITGEDTLRARDILDTIAVLNGQNGIGVEDFIKSIKRSEMRCSQPNILLHFIIAHRIKVPAEKSIRFTPIAFGCNSTYSMHYDRT